MGILSGNLKAEEKLAPCRPSLDDLIKRNREEILRYQMVREAILVIDDQGSWELNDIQGFQQTFLAALGRVELRISELRSEIEKLMDEKAKASPPHDAS